MISYDPCAIKIIMDGTTNSRNLPSNGYFFKPDAKRANNTGNKKRKSSFVWVLKKGRHPTRKDRLPKPTKVNPTASSKIAKNLSINHRMAWSEVGGNGMKLEAQ
jgi:hypothetical protein